MTVLLLYAVTVLIWGTTWLPIKMQLGVVPAEVSVAYRFLIASALLFGWCALRRLPLRFSPRDHLFIAGLGLTFFSINYLLFYNGSAFLTSGLVAIVFSTVSLMNIVNARIFFGRRPEAMVLVGALVGVAGLATIFWPDIVGFSLGDGGSVGLLLCLAGTLSASLGTMTSARNQKAGVPVIQANAFGMGYGALAMLAYAAAMGSPLTFEGTAEYTLSLAYLSVFGSVIAFGCFLTLVGRIGPERAAYATVLFPIIALGVSTVFEDYQWSLRAGIGVGLIVLGNALVLLKPLPKRRTAAAA